MRPKAIIAPVDPPPSSTDLCRDGCLSPARAARFLGVSLRTFQRIAGQLLSVRIGTKRVYPRGELVRYLADLIEGQP